MFAVQDLIKQARFDRTFRAKVVSQVSDGKYTILYKKKEYIAKSDINLNIGDLVWLCAPCSNWDELYVQTSTSGKYLPLSGGTVSGSTQFNNEVVTKMGHRVHSVAGIDGTSGYVGICRITIKGNYVNQSIRLKVLQRGRDGGEISIRFNNLNSNDPTLASFKVYQDLAQVKIVKVATGIWDLYIQKSEAWDRIDVVDFQKGLYLSNLVIDWTNNFSASDPGGIVATVVG